MLDALARTAMEAGELIMDIYKTEFKVSYKQDDTPVTLADMLANEHILKRLAELSPGVPIISEEGDRVPYETRRDWERFYLVDPLDGTSGFVKHNDDFTVNIALVERGRAVMGVIHSPVKGLTYTAGLGLGAMRMAQKGSTPEPISVARTEGAKLVAAISRSRLSDDLEAYMAAHGVTGRIRMGSSMKFCLVAEGAAHIYPRFAPLWEWDTAAGQAIVEAAGGQVLTIDGRPIRYNSPALRHTNGFVAWGVPPRFPIQDNPEPG